MKFHIIQPVVVNQNSRSPACASRCRCSILRCSSRMPPWDCTIAFGSPVVPARIEHPERVLERHARRTSSGSVVGDERRPSSSSPSTAVARARHRVDDRVQRLASGRTRARCTGSRAPPAAPSARSARSGRSRSARRSPASRTTRPRPATRTPGTPPRSRGCSACRRRRGRRARRPARAARWRSARVSARSSPHVHSTSSRSSPPAISAERVVRAPPERVLGVVERRPRKPLRAGHLPRREHASTALADPEAIPDRAPEPVEVLDRPALQLAVGLEAPLAHVLRPSSRAAAARRAGSRGSVASSVSHHAIRAAHGDRHALRHAPARGRLAAGHRGGRRRRPVRAQVPRRGAGPEGAGGRDRRRRAGPRRSGCRSPSWC